MLRKLLFFLMLIVLSGTSLTGCCWDCINNSGSETLNFAFSADSLGGTGFRQAELSSAYVIVYAAPGFQGLTDTLRQPAPGTVPVNASLVLTLYKPAPDAPVSFLLSAQTSNLLSWRIMVPAANRIYEVDQLSYVLKESNNECECNPIKERRFSLNGQPQIQTATSPETLLTK